MENNNSKQTALSIAGIAILVLGVIGVSFAFFSYSRTGTSNNVITTGQIFMDFQEENAINLTNQFPMLNSEAIAENGIIKGQASEVAYLNFTVNGYYSSSTGGIDYIVYAIAGDSQNGKNRLQNSEVSVFMTATPDENVTGAAITNNIINPTPVNDAVDTTTGWAIATGKIQPGTTSANDQTDSYTLAMFVNDTVRISDTDLSVKFTGARTETSATKYCASARTTYGVDEDGDGNNDRTDVSGCELYYTNPTAKTGLTKASSASATLPTGADWLPVYSTMYYSLKLKVVGNQ